MTNVTMITEAVKIYVQIQWEVSVVPVLRDIHLLMVLRAEVGLQLP